MGQIPCTLRRYKFLGCEIIYREACFLAATSPHLIEVEFLPKGLHDLKTPDMLAKVQAAVDAVKPGDGYEAIILGYARCNDGLIGLEAREIPLVIPRAHDCITFLFGSRKAYRDYFDGHPGTFYLSSGWCERDEAENGDYSHPAYGQTGVLGSLGLTRSRAELAARYGEENAAFIVETMGGWLRHYRRFLYLEMGIRDESPLIEAARAEAERRGWEFELRRGNLGLLRRLFAGEWDEDFAVVPPGGRIAACHDERVLGVE